MPFGVVGGRLYHVITDHDLYFGPGGPPIDALYVWRGGLGIWGAIALGGVGVWIGAQRKGIRVPPVLDAMAPGVLVAQAMGRWGNWFNQGSSASRRPSRGRSRSTPRTGRPATSSTPPSSRRSSTSRSGTSPPSRSCCGPTGAGSSATAG